MVATPFANVIKAAGALASSGGFSGDGHGLTVGSLFTPEHNRQHADKTGRGRQQQADGRSQER
jgi:hypothetical protein